MKKGLITAFFCCFFFVLAFSQDYFQQELDYHIKVELNDKTNSLSGFQRLLYINNSPDTLSFIWMHLWPNAYRDNFTPFAKQQLYMRNKGFYMADAAQKGYIDSLDFSINGQAVLRQLEENAPDIAKIPLLKKLLPGDSILITTPFYVKIPDDFSRLGHKEQSYQITQWYPKPAVYDENGWHPMSYLDMGEFYSEFGNFVVEITLPENYYVAATGELQNNAAEEQRLQERINFTNNKAKFKEEKSSDIPSSSKKKTLVFSAENVHDFAWFADKSFLIRQDSVELASGKKIQTAVFFPPKKYKTWFNAVDYVNDALLFYSDKFGEYPYPHATAVCGALSAGGGMEYPMITVISSAIQGNPESIIVHEVGHNWFYGVLATDERAEPWLDESINTFAEYWQAAENDRKFPLIETENEHFKRHLSDNIKQAYYAYLYPAKQNSIQAVGSHSDDYSMINYGAILYAHGAGCFHYLKEYLGEEEFSRIMKIYYEKWKFKHPQGKDLIAIFKQESQKNLDWFFTDIIYTTKTIDYSITSVKKNKGKDSLIICLKNKGEINAPIPLEVFRNDSLIDSRWIDGFSKKKRISIPYSNADELVLDYFESVPEINRGNNRYRLKSLFPKARKIKLAPLYRFESSKEKAFLFLPALGYNYHNGFMLGAFLYSDPAFLKSIDYRIVPMYAFGDQKITLFANLGYNFRPREGLLRKIRPAIPASIFSYNTYDNQSLDCMRLAPEIRFFFRSNKPQQSIYSQLLIRHVNISREQAKWNADEAEMQIGNANYYVNNIRYIYENKNLYRPKSFYLDVQQNQDMMKFSAEGSFKFNYANPKKGFTIRSFFGSFLYSRNTNNIDYRFNISGQRGADDYLFDYVFLGRNLQNGNILSQQYVMNQGGFAIYTAVGKTWDWVWTLNLNTDLPGKIPFSPYLNLGTTKDVISLDMENLLYEGGIRLNIIRDMIFVDFPIFYSPAIKNNVDLMYDNYGQKIRFSLRIDLLNPFLYIDKPETLISYK